MLFWKLSVIIKPCKFKVLAYKYIKVTTIMITNEKRKKEKKRINFVFDNFLTDVILEIFFNY